ncbi:mRNA export factor [Nematocida sp. AWRm77]|nr:mRNA export factor [Nematocida sp. AWRm77]
MFAMRENTLPEIIVPQPPTDTISSLLYSPVNNRLLTACSWDGSVYIYSTDESGSQDRMQLKTSIPNPNSSPILCSCFSADGTMLFTGSADGAVRVIDMNTGNQMEFGGHSLGVSCMAYTASGYLVTGSWDKKVKFWNPKAYGNSAPVKEHTMEEKVYALDTKGSVIVVCLGKNIIVSFNAYDLSKIHLPSSESTGYSSFGQSKYGDRSTGIGTSYGSSSINSKYVTKLTWQIRTVACMYDSMRAVIGAIDGRVDIIAVQETKDQNLQNFFAFKCHRENTDAYPVNKLLVHPVYHDNVLTCGGNGTYTLWNIQTRSRIKTGGPGLNNSITSAAFDMGGKHCAYSIGYDWSKGYVSQINVPVEIRIAPIPEQSHMIKK